MKMKKLTVILLSILLVITMIACVDNGQSDESGSESKAPASNGQSRPGETYDDDILESQDSSDGSESENNASAPSEESSKAPESASKPESSESKSSGGVIELPMDTFG